MGLLGFEAADQGCPVVVGSGCAIRVHGSVSDGRKNVTPAKEINSVGGSWIEDLS